jgi:hypothetical protein
VRPADQLAAGSLRLAGRRRDLVIAGIEGFAQDEGGPLLFRQAFHRPEQGKLALLCQRKAFLNAQAFALHQWLRQPRAGIGFPPCPGGPKRIDGDPCGGAAQPGTRVFDSVVIGPFPAQPGVLYRIFGAGALAQHAVTQGRQGRAFGFE